ncbi:arylamine N-acetyltransferase [Bacillus sp. MUM 116]|uniref:arylamine N-acetyltransferase family protein n=1 Tax=Bacillus sp. MUM 116 TaxID=1678002 RepID=UPI0008F57E30|nr:arylamine N-acetyltransferase [Bacillus sp. MUM 116]OIK15711.1 arylamine N-acetyltransferase [Bacillus sp. MUM 116]
MTNINIQFRNRIGFPEYEPITFDNLATVLEKSAKSIPFENLCIIANRTNEITKENLINKIIRNNEGGLCYELNGILHIFLLENGFDAKLIYGVVYDHKNQRWSTTGRSHVANIITHNGEKYLVDTGFGANLPLKPVPLTGEIITSSNGKFRVEKVQTEHGNYILYMKLKYKDAVWKIGYAFDTTKAITDHSELNNVQKIIIEHPESSFNKKPLITQLTDKGSVTLTDNSVTEWIDGKVEKQDIDPKRYKVLAKNFFGIQA